MKEIVIKLRSGVGGFAEDKDEARRIRTATLLPALEKDQVVILDFGDVKYSTQSFVHALLGEVLQRFQEPVLENLEFRHCSPQLKSLVQLVIDYSLGGFTKAGVVNDKPKHPRVATTRGRKSPRPALKQ